MDEEFLAGINRVKKKYPLIYRQFKDKWEQLYEEHAKGVSREVCRKFTYGFFSKYEVWHVLSK
ncbi:hypothetical protein [Aneurinibacillus aneurinilyticus]|uniref:Uncharacterized protein n=1 Tax=Aneurinibacillus aneurinilyticus TaxID=1391 RepID=A0A848CZA1_ANEAE|nr:hypothetical protein [Aneurinibacillus aneurinilyticus]NME99819.1 hypothetical protein [Aneurinibacillus aneurinilyticus]